MELKKGYQRRKKTDIRRVVRSLFQNKAAGSAIGVLLAVFLVFGLTMPVQAAKIKNRWVEKNNTWYYYNAKGKKAKGLVKIKGKQYLFTSRGVQQYGWRKVGKNYYRFAYMNGKKGYALTSCKRNGIVLGKDGKAVVKNANVRRKLEVMVLYQGWVDEITTSDMNRKEKLKACFDYLRNELHYRSLGEQNWKTWWDVTAAEQLYRYRYYNCFLVASGFAYMANALGYKKVEVNAHFGHGWTLINGKIYDVSLSRHDLFGYTMFGAASPNSEEQPCQYRRVVRNNNK